MCFVVFIWFAGWQVPGINESHYWIKVAHFWEPDRWRFDAFAASADVHWFFYFCVGWLTSLFSLPVAVWTGRVIGWIGLAMGWSLLAQQFRAAPWSGAVSSLLFLIALERGHVSGEWVIGGVESKGFAYACALTGMAFIVSDRWRFAWIWLGLASAFHVIVGGWITLAALLCLVSEMICMREERARWVSRMVKQMPWLVAGGVISLLGLLPAMNMNRGMDGASIQAAHTMYVYRRLAHHLSPMNFSWERWWMHGQLMIVVMVVWFCLKLGWNRPRKDKSVPDTPILPSVLAANAGIRRIWCMAWFGMLFALIGLSIDFAWGSTEPDRAARWLRYYWFRWHDVAWPLVVALSVLWIATQSTVYGKWVRILAALVLVVPGLGMMFQRNWRQIDDIPAADLQTLLLRDDSTNPSKVYQDWIAVCEFAKSKSSDDAIWLTPRHQQTFKWNSQRSELVCWKDIPQDARGLLEWHRRIQETEPWATGNRPFGGWVYWMRNLQSQYGIRYAIVDLRIHPTIPSFPRIYPLHDQDDPTFVVLEIPVVQLDRTNPHAIQKDLP